MILANDIKLLTKNGLRECLKPNIRFYLNDTLITKGFDYKTGVTDKTLYSINIKDGCFQLFEGNVLTSRGYIKVEDLEIGDILITHTVRNTDYGATSVVLGERVITAISSSSLGDTPCIEAPYDEIIVDGLYLRA